VRKSFVNGWERNALPIEPTLIDDREIHPLAAKLQAMFWTDELQHQGASNKT
jgi:hypothetical protein